MKTMTRWARDETGMALIVVLLMIFIFTAVGAFLILAVDRNSELRGAFQKDVAGFQAAEAGINLGAATVLNKMGNNILPSGSDCNANFGGSPLSINGRSVTYTLSGCGLSSVLQTLPADDPFAGLSAYVYTYTLTSNAVNSLGFTEASLKMQFYARQIPMYQFVSFNSGDMVVTPGPPAVSTGRSHSNGNVYLDNQDCGGAGSGGLQILGQITFVGGLYRGNPQSQTRGHVWISTDGTQSNEVVFGENSPGDTSCVTGASYVAGRGPIAQSEINTFGGRVRQVKNITLPGGHELYCAPWDCPGSMAAGANTLWQKADLRIVLDLTAASAHLSGSYGPALPPINVLDALGNVDSARTTQLHTLMQTVPGVITYTDVPTGGTIDCRASISGTYPACEGSYRTNNNYTPRFNAGSWTCPGTGTGHGPRALITTNNYCYDYRYGGYYDWADAKPRKILNVDWMALEEWNRNNANALFNPAGGAGNNGVDVFLSVKGPNSTGVNNYGVRVFDAARARRGTSDLGVTFASDQWMYVAGTFNCPSPNTSGGTGVPETCGASGAQKGTSIVGDRLDQLSCAWLSSSVATTPCSNFGMDADQWPGWNIGGAGISYNSYRLQDEYSTCGQSGVGGCTVNDPVPSPYGNGTPGGVQYAATTYSNHASLVGSDPTWCPTDHSGLTCASQWSGPGTGGLDEDWTGRQYWFITAGASLDTSQHTCYAYLAGINPTNDPSFSCNTYTAQGFYDRRYAPPQRLGFYDTSFNTPGNLPPVTPFFVSLRQVLFTEPFQ